MKKLGKALSNILAIILVLSLSGCASINLQVGGVKLSQLRSLNNVQTAQTQPSGSWPPNRQQNSGSNFYAIQTQAERRASAPTSPYFTGDGGRGRSITILPPRGSGLANIQAYLPDLVANELVSNFSSFSAMTLFDRVNNQRQYEELLSGYYSDNDSAGMDLGNLASTDYMMLGNITRTTTGYALQLTINRNSDKTTVAAYSGAVSVAELDNLTGVRRASLDLLQKMGVQLTDRARTELTRPATVDRVNAQTAMAQGLTAQRQGTSVAALTYFFQAEAFDASLVEAVSRTNVLSANISTGNIGANVRNDFAWHDDWRAKLTETETFINNMLRNTTTQRSIWYSDNVWEQESARDPLKRTTELRIEAVLHTQAAFPVSVQRTVQAVYDGLQTTGRASAWKLDGWPRQGVTNTNPFTSRWGGMVSIAFEVLNDKNQVIGRQTVEMDSRYSFNGTRLDGPGTAFTTVRFTGVNGLDITDGLTIRIATINGRPPAEAGISQIAPISTQRITDGKNLTIYNGVIRPSSNNSNIGAVTIPAELWGERVTAMAFEKRGLTRVIMPPGLVAINNNAFADNRLTSIAIPEGVTTIGDRAFAGNHWTANDAHHGLRHVTIPDSVTSIGQEAFAGHYITRHSSQRSDGSYYNYTVDHWLIQEVTIGADVTLGTNAFGGGFEAFYANEGRQAGVYRINPNGRWERFDNTEVMGETYAKRAKRTTIGMVVLGVLLIGGLIAWAILDPDFFKSDSSTEEQ
jgi:hypothetical protein